jgi:serine/threonine protein kinase
VNGVLFGEYRIVRALASTRTYMAFAGCHVTLDRPVCIRVAHDPSFSPALAHEADVLAGLCHAGIPTLHDTGALADGRRWLATGAVGRATVEAADVLHAPAVEALIRDLCGILEHAHAEGIVLRALRPGSVVLPDASWAGTVTTIAEWIDAQHVGRRAALVHAESGFVAPEVVRSASGDARGDLYSVGAIAYRALTGAIPAKPWSSCAGGNYVGAAERCPGAPAALTALIDHLLADDAWSRPGTCAEVLELLGDDESDGVTVRRPPVFDFDIELLTPVPRAGEPGLGL